MNDKIVQDLELVAAICSNSRHDHDPENRESDIDQIVPILAKARSRRHTLAEDVKRLHDRVEHEVRWIYGIAAEHRIEEQVEIV